LITRRGRRQAFFLSSGGVESPVPTSHEPGPWSRKQPRAPRLSSAERKWLDRTAPGWQAGYSTRGRGNHREVHGMAIALRPAEAKQLTGIELMGHLYRRAGFGATRDQLEAALARGYEATVEELLHPENAPPLEEDVI